MAKSEYYFPFMYQRFLTSTYGWSEEQIGAYLLLLIHQFDRGFVPDDLKEVKKISKFAAKNWSFFDEKFPKSDSGVRINPTMDSVRKKINSKRDKLLRNGMLGGRRNNQMVSNEEPSGNQMGNQMGNQLVQNSETKWGDIPLTINQNKLSNDNLFSIEHCGEVALKDTRWVEANQVSRKSIDEFNAYLTEQGTYQMQPMDYKRYFANLKRKGKLVSAAHLNTNPKNQTEHGSAREASHASLLEEVLGGEPQ